MSTAPIQVALTGITGYGNLYLYLMDESPKDQSQLRAVTAINRGEQEERCRELEENGVEVYTRFEEMLAACRGKVDLSVLPVPIHLHLPMTLASQEAGMHVLLEKPMAATVAQGKTLCEADGNPTRIAIGFQDMYRPSTHRILSELKDGRIGNLTGIRVLALWPRGSNYYTRNNWAGALEVNGETVRDSPVNNATAHFTNLALSFAGAVQQRMARPQQVEAELFRAREIPAFDTAVARVQTDMGVPLQICVTHACKKDEVASITVLGDKGSMTWVQGKELTWEVAGNTQTEALESINETHQGMWESVLTSLRDGSPFCCTPEMAMSHLEVVEALHTGPVIRNFPASLLKTHHPRGDEHIYLPGLDQDLKRCLKTGKLPSELELPWA